MGAKPSYFNESVLVTIAPDADSDLEKTLIRFVSNGGRLLVFGPVDHSGPAFLDLLNLQNVSPLEGELSVKKDFSIDVLEEAYPKVINHRSLFSAGGIRTKLKNRDDPSTRLLASVERGAEERDVVWSRSEKSWNGGTVVYVRGTNSAAFDGGRLLTPDDPEKYFIGQLYLRYALDEFGIRFGIEKEDPSQRSPVTTVSRSNNAFIFSGYNPHSTVKHHFKFPQGAPLLLGFETKLADGNSTYTLPTAWNRECRIFIEQPEGTVSYKELHSGQKGISKRFTVRGLKDATLRVYAEDHVTGKDLRAYVNSGYPWRTGEVSVKAGDPKFGKHFVFENITGDFVVAW
jgi:hypothetical protein